MRLIFCSFAYPSRPLSPVLVNFSLVIGAGEHVGFCGPSGSGKSTLILLLMRYYDPQSGAVLVDGVDVRNWNLRALRDCIGLVQQVRSCVGVAPVVC
jgi:ABC-type multidrug transport system fused ATPase/permease subunit